MVGRDVELAQLHGCLERALTGERQVVFVTWEPGIGKTTVVDAFLHQAAARGGTWLGRGQCIEHYGAGEAYLPLLKAVRRLYRENGGERLIALLNRHAPTWLAQMPALLSDTDLEALQRKVQGATRDRMLREFAELVEAVSAEQPFVLALEDLHWSDPSTLDVLTLVAQRREAARLLVLGTYRPADVIVREHPLRAVTQELRAHGLCEELPLGFLSEAAMAEYLARRFSGSALPPQLARVIHRSTEGNPLFMVNVVDYLVMQGVLREVQGCWRLQATPEDVTVGIPESLRHLIERQIERLPREEQRILEVASVAGAEFSALAVAAGVEEGTEQVEARCEGLVRHGHFLYASGTETVSDGTLTGRYGFLHALYQSVVYERVGAIQRIRLHRRIGERLEKAYGNRTGEIAAELAVHFEQGQDYRRAIQYLQQAAQNTLQRSAHREAISHLSKALELLKTLPDMPERTQQELALQLALGSSLMATKGWSAPEVAHPYTRARELCQLVGETPQLAPVLWGLVTFYGQKGDAQTAGELAEQLMRLPQNTQDPAALILAHRIWGVGSFYRGKLVAALDHLEQAFTLYDRQQHQAQAFLTVYDSGVHCRGYAAGTLWFLGYPAQALQRLHEALTLARELSHPNSLAYALNWAIPIYQFRREVQMVHEQAEALIALSTVQGLPFFLASGTIGQGWVLAEQGQTEEGIAQIRQGLATKRAIGPGGEEPSLLVVLAEACGRIGQTEEGLAVVAEALALVNKRGLRVHEAELYRLKGELSLQSEVRSPKSKLTSSHPPAPSTPAEAEAEACFLKAIKIARRQQAKSLELRAVMSLSRLWLRQRKKKKAQQMLAEIYNWFTEGFETKDLQEAKALLDELR